MPRPSSAHGAALLPSAGSIGLADELARDVFPRFAHRRKSLPQAGRDFCRCLVAGLHKARAGDTRHWEPCLAPLADRLAAASPRLIGEVYERLLDSPERNAPHERRRRGAYFTPAPLVQFIVGETLTPVLARWWQRVESRLTAMLRSSPSEAHWRTLRHALAQVTVCDPAAGAGFFLLDATDLICRWIGQQCGGMHSDYRARLPALVAEHCLAGIDVDPQAIELARAAIELQTGFDPRHAFRAGDAILGPESTQLNRCWQAVVGNPPYLGHRADVEGEPLRRHYRTCRQQPNLAAAFLEKGLSMLAPAGRCGLILPKAVQYVASWRAARTLLTRDYRLETLVDAREAFEEVLLEQTIVVAESREPEPSASPRNSPPPPRVYRGGAWPLPEGVARAGSPPDLANAERKTARRRAALPPIALAVAEELDCLPAEVDPRSLALWRRLRERGPRLGAVSRTAQALGYQAKLGPTLTGERIAIHRGKQVRPLVLEPAADSIDKGFLVDRRGAWTKKVAELLEPKVVSQNIIAHVRRPSPRLWIISAPDDVGRLCLNTISATWVQDDRFTRAYVAAVLNSTLASWFFSELVFCRAVRTMHLDDTYVGKLPLAEIPRAQQRQFAQLANSAAAGQLTGSALRAAIDRLVFAAYQVTDREQAFLREYCYGPPR